VHNLEALAAKKYRQVLYRDSADEMLRKFGTCATLSPLKTRSEYRPDIDGLRAVAVIAVILYHLSVPGFAGGLVGVDIFFVVSGFVITRLLYSRVPDGSITLVWFYERRVRRLAPALMIVLLASFIAAFFLLLPSDFEQFTASLLATVLCVSNVLFARWYGDYFASDAASNPLLHTWSLGVEEQFYALYPIGLVVLFRYGVANKTVFNILLGAGALSFAMASVGGVVFPSYAFFTLPARIWELMLGAIVARVACTRAAIPTIALPWKQALCVVGLICIGLGIVGVPFPRILPQPLLACIGTAILIHANSSSYTVVKALLSNSTFVWIGVISYSLYLWHWPIIVFYRYYFVGRPLDLYDTALILGITIVAAIVTWSCAEQPIRARRLLNGRRALSAVALGGSVVLILLAAVGLGTGGLPGRLPRSVAQFADGKSDVNPDRGKCILKEPENVLTNNFCRLGIDNGAAPSLMVWGDSHADTWMPVFNDLARENGVAGLIAAHGGCPPLLGVKRVVRAHNDKCVEFNNAVFAAVVRYHITRVVLVGRWSWYIYGVEEGGVEEGRGAVIAKIGESEAAAANIDSRKEAFRAGITEAVAQLRKIGAQVWVIDQAPTYKVEVPQFLAYSAWRGMTAKGRLREEVRQRHQFQIDVFNDNELEIIDLPYYMCPPEEAACRLEAGERSLYRDYNHLSVFGAQTIAKWAAPVFKKVVAKRVQPELQTKH
jgi:peptidoglycan/LPS O-acetylase OafA/YrhL